MTPTDPAERAALLPCPFCGSADIHQSGDNGYGSFWVACESCGISTNGVGDANQAEANARWNARATPAAVPPAGAQWTLTAPDGRQWQAESALRCAALELNSRVPATTQLERILAAAAEPDLAERHVALGARFGVKHADDLIDAQAARIAELEAAASETVAWATVCDDAIHSLSLAEEGANIRAEMLRDEVRGRDFKVCVKPLAFVGGHRKAAAVPAQTVRAIEALLEVADGVPQWHNAGHAAALGRGALAAIIGGGAREQAVPAQVVEALRLAATALGCVQGYAGVAERVPVVSVAIKAVHAALASQPTDPNEST